ncbi:hypothetical protein [Oceaniglobus trochenteri]|uniref:hypothetical protein n=1 Tax=Oceaniglobus trochenteri TaxID=2763260 RepID=UPI001D0019A2|nr:hypothetical protein [Oceaniglobus trochenteri]
MLRIIALSLVACPALADVKGPGGRVIDCYCTDSKGGRVELGQSICLNVNGRMFTAQCQMSLNVPMWREISEGCLSSRFDQGQPLPQSLKPPFDPGAVDAHI